MNSDLRWNHPTVTRRMAIEAGSIGILGLGMNHLAGLKQAQAASGNLAFGKAKSSATGTDGSALSSSGDPGTIFTAPADGRLRQVLTFTVHLRNDQGL